MSSALDMALDDVIGNAPRKGGGKQSKGKGKFQRQSFEDTKEGKLDKSLDEIVDGSFRGKSKGKGKAFGGSWGGQGFSKGYSKGKGKNSFKGKGSAVFGMPDFRPSWLDRDVDDDDGRWSSKGSRMGKGAWPEHDERGLARREDSFGRHEGRLAARGLPVHATRGAMRPVARPVTTSGGFQRIEYDEDEDEPPRRRPQPTRPMASRTAAAPAKRLRARDDSEEERPRAKVAKKTATKSVKVTNIPKELKARDVREAFESETGKATACELSKGTAIITFSRATDAVKAVEAFHKGELNGKIISVVLVDA